MYMFMHFGPLTGPVWRQIAALLIAFWFGSAVCGQSLQRYEYTHPQMGTIFRLIFYAPDSTVAQAARRAVFAKIDTLNAIYSDYLPDSELSRLGQTAGTGRKVPVSPELWDILRAAHHFSKKSNGAFDVTVGALTRLWRRSRSLKELPDTGRVEQALRTVGYQHLKYYRRKRSVMLTRPGTRLDLGGIAQGYAADAGLAILRRYGIRHALFDAGGDIALGEAPPGEPGWKIETPSDTGRTVVHYLRKCGITTSGAQYRYLEIDGRRYSHIIDPRTGWGLTHRVLVTVQAPNALMADAWATAISVLGTKPRKRFLKVSMVYKSL
jgi:FAD:protein FMN transferase